MKWISIIMLNFNQTWISWISGDIDLGTLSQVLSLNCVSTLFVLKNQYILNTDFSTFVNEIKSKTENTLLHNNSVRGGDTNRFGFLRNWRYFWEYAIGPRHLLLLRSTLFNLISYSSILFGKRNNKYLKKITQKEYTQK